ncbi:hypothetical protein SE86_04665 [Acidilobus sp. 7A]|nr:hypothetical protein SE86_04665 [Acidilobus sp. 7A]
MRRVARTLRPLEEVIRLRRWSLSTSSAAGSQLNYSADCRPLQRQALGASIAQAFKAACSYVVRPKRLLLRRPWRGLSTMTWP